MPRVVSLFVPTWPTETAQAENGRRLPRLMNDRQVHYRRCHRRFHSTTSHARRLGRPIHTKPALNCPRPASGPRWAAGARRVVHQDLQSVLRCHIAALEAIGAPREILYDRMKTAGQIL
jgi:hypothetical protein